jgi:hypothetical protein
MLQYTSIIIQIIFRELVGSLLKSLNLKVFKIVKVNCGDAAASPQLTFTITITKRTNWATFRTLIHETLTLHVPLKTAQDIEDNVQHLVQQAAWNSTPLPHTPTHTNTCAPPIKQKIMEKMKLRKGSKSPDRHKTRQLSTRL